ncbi:MAG: hypothetical protein K9L64_00115 [Candidatus Izimaplasma sp.]|nr:hypothetical protein [Candidatus Izimaplasma bacterium]
MKKLKNSLLVIFLIILSIPLTVNVKAESTINIHYFYDEFCLNCREAEAYLNDLVADNDNLNIIKYEVIKSEENENLFFAVKDVFGRDSNSVPYIVIGGVDFPNFYNSKEKIEEVIEYYENNSFVDVVEKVKNDEVILESDLDADKFSDQYVVDIPLFGEIDLANTTLFFGAVVVGLVDGFNPCAMWVLLFMIMMLINLKDRKRMLYLGLTFILTSGIIYFLIMMSWLQIVIALSTINIVKILIGILALVFSLYSFRSFWRKRKEEIGCEVTNKNQRKILSSKLTKIIQKESLLLAILGIIVISISVNFIELACSLGLPLFYTSLLAMHGLSTAASAGYILIYVLFFILDDLIIFLLAFFTLKVTGISNRYMKYTHLIGGIIMFIIAIGLLFFPELLLL